MRVPSMPLTALAAVVVLSACSAEKSEEAAAPAAAEAVANDATGPTIDRSIAPGVAFTFDYAFTLPAKAITGVQREHTAACARLGPSRCRVTGMAYDQPREGEVSARLDFLLAPDLAQAFASDAIGAVEKADGVLDNAKVAGENAGETIKLSQADSAGIEAEVKRIEARLAAKGLSGSERVELQQQLAALREQLRGNAQQRKGLEQSIATTPVTFAYSSEGILAGKGTFSKAAGASLTSMSALGSFLLLLLGTLGPWVALIALVWFTWTRLRRRLSPVEPVRQD
ncbi:MAG: DUF4349 domain-containing protein [Sphingomonadaceae bacterium]|nr:DUF4349 domain-containing protein [Sphingomonadaceae bacterium]